MSHALIPSSPPPQPLGRGKKIIFSLLMVGIVLGMLEGLSALYLNFFSRDPRPLSVRNVPWHVYDAYRNHAPGPGWNSQGRIHNAQGFRRSTDVSLEKPANTFRVFLLGGSAAYGISAAPPFPPVVITNEQTIDYKLEQLLQPMFPDRKIEIINAAVTAYWTHHHLINLHEVLLDYDPDLIIFFDGINDYYHTNPDHRQFQSYNYSMVLRTKELNDPRPLDALHVMLDWGKHYSYAVYALAEAADRFFRWNEPPADADLDEPITLADLNSNLAERYETISRRTWMRTLRSILLTLKDQKIPAIITLQPELVFAQTQGMSAGDLQLREIELARRPAHYTERKEFLKPIARRLAAATAEDLGATFVDLTDVFDDHDQYFIDYCHLSEAGAGRIAERLLPHVKDKLEHTTTS